MFARMTTDSEKGRDVRVVKIHNFVVQHNQGNRCSKETLNHMQNETTPE